MIVEEDERAGRSPNESRTLASIVSLSTSSGSGSLESIKLSLATSPQVVGGVCVLILCEEITCYFTSILFRFFPCRTSSANYFYPPGTPHEGSYALSEVEDSMNECKSRR